MVFSNLGHSEKQAFFTLLDEYFDSRPHLFASISQGSTDHSAAKHAAANVLANNPGIVAAGLRAMPKDNSPGSHLASNPAVQKAAAGMVADQARMWSQQASSSSGPTSPPIAPKPPPMPPRRTSSQPSDDGAEVSRASSIADKPAPTARRFGDVDTTSAKGFYSSLRNSTANKNKVHAPPIVPPAFPKRASNFAPPPSRRDHEPALEQEQEPEEEQEEATHGEWAEALYDYDSAEPGDLPIRANQRVLVTERTSDQWWTGEFQGQTGLFPASYVKVL